MRAVRSLVSCATVAAREEGAMLVTPDQMKKLEAMVDLCQG
jgi:hypothetical protein